MMKFHTKVFLATACAVSVLTTTASAGIITAAAPNLISPGLGIVSVPLILTTAPGNDNTFDPQSGNNINIITKAFEHNDYIDIVFTVAPSSPAVSEYRVVETVDNDTGVDWSSYILQLGTGTGAEFIPSPADDGLDFDTPEKDPAPTSGIMTSVLHNQDMIVYSGGIHSSIQHNYEFRIDVPNLLTFTVRQVPVQVPEPGTMLLAGLAWLGLIGLRRHR